MSKKYLIDETAAQLIFEHFVEMPYKQVYRFCDILRNLDPAPDFSTQLKQYHDFIVQKGLWDEFVDFQRWLPGMEEAEAIAQAKAEGSSLSGGLQAHER